MSEAGSPPWRNVARRGRLHARGAPSAPSVDRYDRWKVCQRNRDSTLARAQRGLWNGGVLLGYDLAEKKGTLLPNASEASIVRLVDAVWPGIVDPEIFAKVQTLMARNATTKKNVAGKVRHTFVFSRGLLHCGTCSRPMDCKSGTSAKGTTYFYYRCRVCGLNVPAAEIEKVVVQRIREIVRDKKILSKLVDETNLQLQEELPQLQERRTALERNLTEVKRQVSSLVSKLVDLEGSEALCTREREARGPDPAARRVRVRP